MAVRVALSTRPELDSGIEKFAFPTMKMDLKYLESFVSILEQSLDEYPTSFTEDKAMLIDETSHLKRNFIKYRMTEKSILIHKIAVLKLVQEKLRYLAGDQNAESGGATSREEYESILSNILQEAHYEAATESWTKDFCRKATEILEKRKSQ